MTCIEADPGIMTDDMRIDAYEGIIGMLTALAFG